MNGAGTIGDPWQVANLADLRKVGQGYNDGDDKTYALGNYYVQVADIDAGGTQSTAFTKIGAASTRFSGQYDGDGYTIRNFYITGTNDFALFGATSSASVIKNLGMLNAMIVPVAGADFGVIAGENLGVIENCWTTGTIFGGGVTALGGIAGRNDGASSVIRNCWSTVNIRNTDTSNRIGGIVGRSHASAQAIDCWHSGFIDTNSTSHGGCVGDGLGTITRCFWDSDAASKAVSGGGTAKTSAELKNTSTFTGWDFDIWEIDEGDNPRLQNAPLPTPTLISTASQLQDIANDLGGYYALENNIDASATEEWNSGAGFLPIGSPSTPFVGFLDGKGYAVSGITIDRSSTSDCGIFGVLSGGVENISFNDANISGDQGVGVLAGEAKFASIRNTHVGGEVVAAGRDSGGSIGRTSTGARVVVSHSRADVSISGGLNTGGFIGLAFTEGVWRRCYATGNVTSNNEQTGGFVGVARNHVFNQCFATGNVTNTGSGRSEHGGFAGEFEGGCAATNCYATGNVSGGNSAEVGGFIGQYQAASGIIRNCYSTGSVSATGADVGGFCGDLDGPSIVDCFWDTETSGQATDGPDSTATGKTTAQMQDIDTYTDTATAGLDNAWDMVAIGSYVDEIWKIDDGNDYPILGYEVVSIPPPAATFKPYWRQTPQLSTAGVIG